MRIHRTLLSNRERVIGEGEDAVVKKRRHYGRYLLVLILAAWWTLGLLGLDGAGRPSVPLVASAVFAFVVYRVVSSVRRRRGRNEGLYRSGPDMVTPRSCVIVRLGEPGPSPS